MESPFSFTVEESGQRLDLFLAKNTKETRTFVKKQIEAGSVQINAKVITKTSHRLKKDDTVSGIYEEKPDTKVAPLEGKLSIVFEDDDLIVVNKPQGLVVHPAAGHYHETLVHYLLHHLQNSKTYCELSTSRPGIVHRLDKGTSGIILVAKNRKAQEAIARQFKERTMQKEYEAIVWGTPPKQSTISLAIGRHYKDRKRMSTKTPKGREALTRWNKIEQYSHFALLQLFPHSGRTHQLRVHLSESGYPIVGDRLYSRRATQGNRQQLASTLQQALETVTYPFLHAKVLTFKHPGHGEMITVTAPRPANFDKFLTLVRNFDS